MQGFDSELVPNVSFQGLQGQGRRFAVHDSFPDFGPEWGGQKVYISGLGFNTVGVVSVLFDSTQSSSIQVLNNRLLVCTAPSGVPLSTAIITVQFNNSKRIRCRRQYSYSGWVQISTISNDASAIYISNAGSDSNNGITSSTPKLTLAAGMALLNSYPNGKGHRLYLRKGDTWDEGFGQLKVGGKSEEDRLIITGYGSGARPIVRGTTSLNNGSVGIITNLGGNSPSAINYVMLDGIEMYKQNFEWETNIQPNAVTLNIPSTGWLIQDCYFHDLLNGIVLHPLGSVNHNDITISRCILYRNRNHGLYSQSCNNLVLQENTIHHNGWKTDGPTGLNYANRHNVYIRETNVSALPTMRGNSVMYASYNGLMVRTGGYAYENFFYKNPTNLLLGGGDVGYSGGVSGIAQRNVVVGSKNTFDGNAVGGIGIILNNCKSGDVSFNLICNNVSGHQGPAIGVNGNTSLAAINVGVSATIRDNVTYNWGVCSIQSLYNNATGSLIIQGPASAIKLNIRDNNFIELIKNSDVIQHNANSVFTYPDNYSPTSITINDANNLYRVSGGPDWCVLRYVFPMLLTASEWASGLNNIVTTNNTLFSSPSRDLVSYVTSLGGGSSEQDCINQILAQSQAAYDENYTAWKINDYIRSGFDIL